MKHSDVLMLLVTSTCLSCSTEPEDQEVPFSPQVITSKLRVTSPTIGDYCAENIQLLDEQVCWLRDVVPVDEALPAWLQLYEGNEAGTFCGFEAGGCWSDPVAHSIWNSASHELVHAHLSSLNSEPLPFFSEGFATMMEGSVQWGTASSPLIRSLMMAETSEDLRYAYEDAASFCRWIYEEYGLAELIQIYSQSFAFETSPEQLSQVFNHVLGEPLDTVLEKYDSRDYHFFPGLGPFSCGTGQQLGLLEATLTVEGELLCEASHTLGQYLDDDELILWRRWSLEVDEPGQFLIDSGNHGAQLTYCLSAPSNIDTLPEVDVRIFDEALWNLWPLRREGHGVGLTNEVLWLNEGKYDLWVARPATEDDNTYFVELTRVQ